MIFEYKSVEYVPVGNPLGKGGYQRGCSYKCVFMVVSVVISMLKYFWQEAFL